MQLCFYFSWSVAELLVALIPPWPSMFLTARQFALVQAVLAGAKDQPPPTQAKGAPEEKGQPFMLCAGSVIISSLRSL